MCIIMPLNLVYVQGKFTQFIRSVFPHLLVCVNVVIFFATVCTMANKDTIDPD